MLVTVLCVGLGWIGVQLKWIHDRHEALRLTASGGNTMSPWSIRILGEPGIKKIFVQYLGDQRSDEARAAEIQRLYPESHVELVDIEDYGKKHNLPEFK